MRRMERHKNVKELVVVLYCMISELTGSITFRLNKIITYFENESLVLVGIVSGIIFKLHSGYPVLPAHRSLLDIVLP